MSLQCVSFDSNYLQYAIRNQFIYNNEMMRERESIPHTLSIKMQI